MGFFIIPVPFSKLHIAIPWPASARDCLEEIWKRQDSELSIEREKELMVGSFIKEVSLPKGRDFVIKLTLFYFSSHMSL